MALDLIISAEDQVEVRVAARAIGLCAVTRYTDLTAIIELMFLPPVSHYLVCTSDGEIHQFMDEESFINCIDQYGPEVVDTAVVRGPIGGVLL